MGHIFISYSRKDLKLVDRLSERLRLEGYQIWLDRTGIGGGQQWPAAIVEAIESATVFLIVLSRNSVASSNVRKELHIAVGAEIPILPVETEEVEPTGDLRYHLAGVQRIQFANDENDNFNLLLVELRSINPPEKHVKSKRDKQYEIAQNWDGKTSMAGFDLSGRDLYGADLSFAILRRANLSEANLVTANLAGANLNGANLRSAHLSSANLVGAHLHETILSGAGYNEHTKWPEGFDPEDAGARLLKFKRKGEWPRIIKIPKDS